MREIAKGAAKEKDEVTYIYLLTHTEKGRTQSAADRKRGANDVTKAVRQAGGQCRLYSTKGSAFDYISVITGIAPVASVSVAEEIEKLGAVKATLVSGVELFNMT
ncbi:hypothetical protein [Bradyrhizobium genosp. P]|uniref:hypothetical protein n=1 Tax=Bradyrhizobium genosp. P TaxID=83641 RepID=UPI003CF12B8E